jgi:hypothetical protein
MTPKSKNTGTQRIIIVIASIVLLVLVLLIVGLILGGVFDPKPLGELKFRHELERRVKVDDVYQEPLLQIPSSGPFSVRMGASWISGNPDIGYGLKLGNGEHSVVIAVSPLGYVTIMESDRSVAAPANQVHQLPWQTWPHVSKTDESNEIWVDIEDSNLTMVRINRELLWTGQLPLAESDVDFWAQSFGEPGIVNLEYIELFQDE